ncbi:hypothetical protein NHF48_007320 [Sphingomonas sp. H160509]|uniref:hypothetical protein n=1 Tax=Sphingomonas sp. H160509 TaxID=2955313 RepID=UPI002097A220|nr:hypothetical protein [Sphingomonas sp. H160509]MDD1450811.1 hypothetical protein [Sphingomonas sp. H160509]
MSALPNDIAAATREAIIERYENTAVRDALTGARDGSLQPAEGFFDLLANAKTVVDERGLVLAGDPRFSVSVAALVWSDPSVATPAVRLVDVEQAVDARLCCSRIELDLEEEVTSFELFYAPDVDQTPPATGPMPLWISPNGNGDLSGSDVANAGRLSQLNTFISRAAITGAEVWIRADAGSYNFTSTLTITNGGATVRGVDVNGNPMMAEFVGKRLVDPDRSHMWNAKNDAAAGIYGIEVFRLNRGADNLTFRHLAFRNLGRGCFRARQSLSNLTITDMLATNVAAFFVNDAAVATDPADITGLTMQRVTVNGFSKFFAKIQWNSTNILLEDCIGDSEKQDGDNFASGIVFDDNARDIVMRRCTMGNVVDSLHAYQNGDGYSGERGNINIVMEDCVAHNCTDGGVDFKGDNIVLRRCVMRENHRNYRLWGFVDLYDCEGYDQRADNAAPRPPKAVLQGAAVRVLRFAGAGL